MDWECPSDWKYIPETKDASDAMLMGLVFGDAKRFRQYRIPWFQRCNASGKWIWPMQKAWRGIVDVTHNYRGVSGGKYKVVWLNSDQYLIQKLKGSI